jgi:hypothetical protein
MEVCPALADTSFAANNRVNVSASVHLRFLGPPPDDLVVTLRRLRI